MTLSLTRTQDILAYLGSHREKDNFCAAFLWKRNVCWSMHMENWKEN